MKLSRRTLLAGAVALPLAPKPVPLFLDSNTFMASGSLPGSLCMITLEQPKFDFKTWLICDAADPGKWHVVKAE